MPLGNTKIIGFLDKENKVQLECLQCGEKYERHNSKSNQKHRCPTVKKIEGVLHKWCNSCKKYLPFESFGNNKRSIHGLEDICKNCRYIYNRRDLRSIVNAKVRRKKYQCNKKGIDFGLDSKILLDKLDKQDYSCYYTGIKMDFESQKSPNYAHIERISPELGYIDTNVVWVCKAINQLKGESGLDEFTSFCNYLGLDIKGLSLKVKKLNPDAIIPERSKITDAGYDIRTIEDIKLPPRSVTKIKTGLAISCPLGYYFTIEGRSSLYAQGLVPMRGIIDSTYTGEITIAFNNLSDTEVVFNKNERIAQLCFHKTVIVNDWETVSNFPDEYSLRGENGFGSTGKI